MSTPLSPAAQAVRDAYEAGGLPAAILAASNRTEGLIIDTFHPKFAEGVLAAGDILERIAAELDGGTTSQED